jgi:hypothetical protein
VVVHVSVIGELAESFVPGVYVVIALLVGAKVPLLEVDHVPAAFVVALKASVALLQRLDVAVSEAVAGGYTVNAEFELTAGHGPLPSGSAVVQVSVIVCEVELLGVKVVLVFEAVPNTPAFGLAVQLPVPLAVAFILTALAPHVTKGPKTLAVAAGLIVI